MEPLTQKYRSIKQNYQGLYVDILKFLGHNSEMALS